MAKDLSQDVPVVTGDPTLLKVLATAQRFAAWYAEFLSVSVAEPSPVRRPGVDGPREERREDDLVRHLQHALFDLIAAVHEMNRMCAVDNTCSAQIDLAAPAGYRSIVH